MFVGGRACIKLSNLDSRMEDLTKRGQGLTPENKGKLEIFVYIKSITWILVSALALCHWPLETAVGPHRKCHGSRAGGHAGLEG